MISDHVARTEALDINKSFIVQAPAGSGKTTLLVNRYMKLLEECLPEEIVAITFTNKAAAEMRARILDKIEQEIHPARIKVFTIDSLSFQITTKMPVLSRFGVQPAIDTKPQHLYHQATEYIINNYESLAEMQMILSHLDNNRAKVSDLLISMLACRDHWLEYIYMNNPKEILEKGLQAAIEQQHVKLGDWASLADVMLTKQNQWRKRLKPDLKAKLEKIEDKEALRLQLVLLRCLPDSRYTEEQWQILQALTKILPLLVAQLTLVFKDSGCVDFTEVALSALYALGHESAPTELALDLDYKIKHILVDEFQDTSLIQFKLLSRLVAEWQPGDGRTMFLVGDPMQSIYRFRQAEVGLFIRAKQFGIANIPLSFLRLTSNFRSDPEIVDWVNSYFTEIFPATDDMLLGAIKYSPSVSERDKEQGIVKCINTKQQGNAIAEILSKQENKSCAILVHSRGHLEDILPILRDYSIEYQAVDIEKMTDRQEVLDLISLSRALLHMDDRIAWLALLRSPYCGLLLTELEELIDPEQTVWEKLNKFTENYRVSRVVKILQDALFNLDRKIFVRLLRATWKHLGGIQNLATEKYFQIIAEFEESKLKLPGYIERELEQNFVPTSDNPKAVQIMTIHKAKGLEFDIVIIPHLEKKTQGDPEKLFLIEERQSDENYLIFAPIRNMTQASDSIYEYLKLCEKIRHDYERTRLLYVAATRAKQELYFLADLSKRNPMPSQEFKDFKINTNTETMTELSSTLFRLPKKWYQENIYESQGYNQIDVNKNIDLLPKKYGIEIHKDLYDIALGKKEILPILRNCKHAHYILKQHDEDYAEWQLSGVIDNEIINVVIDRAFRDGSEFWIIDYKVVDNYNESQLIATYRKQLMTYKKVVSGLNKYQKIHTALYMPLQRKIIEI